MGPVEALKTALSQEIAAIKLYQEFADKYPAAQETFLFLVSEEEKHKQLLEKKIYGLSQ